MIWPETDTVGQSKHGSQPCTWQWSLSNSEGKERLVEVRG